jgi:hypothetical protein
MTRKHFDKIAKDLDPYVQYRAVHENVGYALSKEFFAEAIRQGCKEFFGISYNRSGLTGDTQFPELFAEWKSRIVN